MEEIIPVIKKNQRLDLLDRQGFVDRMLTIANALSNLYKENKTGPGGHYKIFYYDHEQQFIYLDGFWGIILSAYRALLGFDEDRWTAGNPFHYSKTDSLQQLNKHTKDFWVILSSIK